MSQPIAPAPTRTAPSSKPSPKTPTEKLPPWNVLLHNDEVNVVVVGEGFAGELERLFADDVAQSEPVDAATWRRRGIAQRAREALAGMLEYWL